MSLFSLFATVVYAAEMIISPIPDDMPFIMPTAAPVIKAPTSSFASLYEIAMKQSQVLGASTSATPTPSPSVTFTPVASPTASIATHIARKKDITISLLGDSMVDTLGPDGGGLDQKLHAMYPGSTFTIINHGVGATNIDYGFERLTTGYQYLGANRPAVLDQTPDVIVVESFGYNPYPLPVRTDALNRHWLKLSEVVDTIHARLPQTKIVIAATIAPNWNVFGDGAPFINMSDSGKREKVNEIDQYIESTISFAQSQHIPLANAYSASRDSSGNGKLGFINGGDHIHYSGEGRALMAQKIAEAITVNRLLE